MDEVRRYSKVVEVVVMEMVEKEYQECDQEDSANVEDVSLVDGVFDGAFGGEGDEDFVIGKGVNDEDDGEDDEEDEDDDYLIRRNVAEL
ncbi:hypothetical protein Tco_0600887 [Tanacetum coccineum]